MSWLLNIATLSPIELPTPVIQQLYILGAIEVKVFHMLFAKHLDLNFGLVILVAAHKCEL